MRVAGVDEAGRGCAIGPLVVAAAVFKEETLPILREIGVKDSKKLSAKKREKLEIEIKELALDYRLFEIQPRVIDKVVFRSIPLRRLNYLETMVMAKLIRELKPDLVHMDPPDVDNLRCAEQVQSVIKYKMDVICEPKADHKYVSTGAASILAKVRRDQRIKELRELHGDFNSGYSSDKKTQQFIEEYFSDNNECPDYMRASWSTVQRHLKPFKQMKL
ncbi:MAG: ribonuclease HII [Candidatus Bathyarchaeota archaeon]|nr:ribonuclease HII [Candidatus Bathyarchaeota archaeon]